MPGCAQHRDFLVISILNDFYTVTVPGLAAIIHCVASYILLVAYFVRNNLDTYQTYAAILAVSPETLIPELLCPRNTYCGKVIHYSLEKLLYTELHHLQWRQKLSSK